jgi:hypothetical protein
MQSVWEMENPFGITKTGVHWYRDEDKARKWEKNPIVYRESWDSDEKKILGNQSLYNALFPNPSASAQRQKTIRYLSRTIKFGEIRVHQWSKKNEPVVEIKVSKFP